MSRVWDHAHCIPGEILPHFDPWHTSVAHREVKLEMDTCRHVTTRDGHVSRGWDHVHWIPGEILPQFDPWHSPVPQLEAELQNMRLG